MRGTESQSTLGSASHESVAAGIELTRYQPAFSTSSIFVVFGSMNMNAPIMA